MSVNVQEFIIDNDKSILQLDDGLYYEDKSKKLLTFFPIVKNGAQEYLLSPFTSHKIINRLGLSYKDLIIYHINNQYKNHKKVKPLDNWLLFMEVRKHYPKIEYSQLTKEIIEECANYGYSENLLKCQNIIKY